MSFLGALQNIAMPGPLGPIGPAVMGGSMAPSFNPGAMLAPQGAPHGMFGNNQPQNPGGTGTQAAFLQMLAQGLQRR